LVTPDFLRKPAVQEWLAGERVKSDFKALARARVLGGDIDDDEATVLRLRSAYAEKTGELDQLAAGPIDVVVAVLVAGYLARIEPSDHALAGVIQAGFAESGTCQQE